MIGETTAAEPVLCDIAGGVATITLNRPDRLNAWDRNMAAGFGAALERVSRDPAVRAIVLTGAGRGFCSGADFHLLDEAAGGEDVSGANNSVLPTDLIAVPKPVIGAINGPAAGLGFVLAMCCDIRFAAAGAKLTAVFPKLALIAEYGSAWLLPRLAGTAVALDVLLSGRVILAEEAERIGLVNRVLEPDALLSHAQAYARDLAERCAPSAMRTIKRQVYSGFDSDLGPALQDSLRLMRESLQGEDFKEGIAANGEKRRPRFRDPG